MGIWGFQSARHPIAARKTGTCAGSQFGRAKYAPPLATRLDMHSASRRPARILPRISKRPLEHLEFVRRPMLYQGEKLLTYLVDQWLVPREER